MLKNIFYTFILSIVAGLSPSPAFTAAAHPAVTLHESVSILMDTTEDAPVKRAVQDLIRDLRKILGSETRLIGSIKKAGPGASLIVVSCRGNETKAFRDYRITGFESHLVTTCQIAGHRAVLLQGADMRGTIYAIYSFSEKILGIPPLWIWASFTPERKTQITVPENTYLYFPPPHVQWRAWFPNDRDLLGPWQAKNEENYDALFETMLRLKLNTREGYLMDMDSWNTPYKAGKEACYARDRGLKISFTHTAPFGAVLTNWERYWTKIRRLEKAPPLLLKNTDGLKDFWRYHIETIRKEKLDVIWQIGFRGMGDKPFWRRTYADAMDKPEKDADRAAIIGSMLSEQVALLKQVTGESHPLMKLTIYNEGSDFLAAGLLHLPDEPTLILNYSAARHDHYPPPDIQNFSMTGNQPIGYYLNFQFTGTGSHLAPGEGPWKMEQNFRYAEDKTGRPLTFSVVNAGNVREHVLELSSNAAMMWNYGSYKTDNFLKDYCTIYFGPALANDITALYRDYYHSYWNPRKADIPGFERQYIFQDMRYARAIEQLCALWNEPYMPDPFNDKRLGLYGAMSTGGRQYNIVPADNNSPNQLEAALHGTAASGKRFAEAAGRADNLYGKLSPEKQAFFNDDLRLQAHFMAELNQAMNNMVQAYTLKHSGKTEEAKAYLDSALKSVNILKDIKAKAGHGRFEGWYTPEKNFNIRGLQKQISLIIQKSL